MCEIIVTAQASNPPWWASLVFFAILLTVALFARNRDAGYFERLLQNDWAARGIGLFSIAFAAGAAYLLVYSPIHKALAHERMIVVPRGAVALLAVFIFIGLVMLLTGKHCHKFVVTRHRESQTSLQWAVMMLGVAFGLALEFNFHRFLHVLGYTARW